jgi:hypothetical protein
VFDLDLRRAAAIKGLYMLVLPWWAQPAWRDRPLGDVLKVLPADRARLAAQVLAWAGFADDSDGDGEAG